MTERTSVWVGLLGPLRLEVDGVPVEVPGVRRRAVLALLAASAGRTVAIDRILDAVWPDEVPDSGRRGLQSHVSRLRGHLGPAADRLVRDGAGYRLDLGPGELDVADARALAGAAEADGGPDALDAALRLWRAPALEEFADVPPLAAEAVALAELHTRLTDDWLAARLAPTGPSDATPTSPDGTSGSGRAAAGDGDLVADATRAASEQPLRERTHGLLVRALAAGGRQAEALRAAHAFRHRLAEETGLDPSPAFDAVEQEVAVGVLAPASPAAPAARSAVARPSSPLVGRGHEVADLRRRLARQRLTTVVGPGGVGKTRLTLEVVADAAAEGTEVVVVELATVEDPTRVVDALATALGVRARSGPEALAACTDALASRPVLVLLDNGEHVLDAARDLVTALLAGCPQVAVAVTSREPLGLADEHLLRLGPLPVPEEGATDPGQVTQAPAVAAFLAHARRRVPDLVVDGDDARLVADVVRRLDGLPLALELAAGRVGTLALPDLHARLDRALDLLRAGRASGSARHRTLRAAIDWSFHALDEDARRLLCGLGVFPGGVDLDTAERVGDRLGLDDDPVSVVAGLVDASMLAAAPGPTGVRYRALETVRAYVRDVRAATGEADRAERELIAWAVDLTAELDALCRGPEEAAADARLRAELPNLAAAWDAAAHRGDLDARVAMVANIDHIRAFRQLAGVATWPLELLDDPGLEGHPGRPTVLGAASRTAWLRGDREEAERLGRECVATATTDDAAFRGLAALATVHLYAGDPAQAEALWVEAAARGGPTVTAVYLGAAALAAAYAGDTERTTALLADAMPPGAVIAPSARALALYTAAEMLAGEDPEAAAERYGEAIALAAACNAEFVEGVAQVGLVRLWAAGGRDRQALAGYRTLLESWRRSGHWAQLWTTLRNLADPLARTGQAETAAMVLAAADAAAEAPLVSVPAVAAGLTALAERLRDELGEGAYAAAVAKGAAASRTEAVDAALAAVDAALDRAPAGPV